MALGIDALNANLRAGGGVREEVGPSPTETYFPAVNSFSLAGGAMPGKWTLTSADKVFGWQIQQGYAMSGAVVFPKGDELIVAKFRGEFWTSQDVGFYQRIRKVLLVKPTIKQGVFSVAALGIDHPELKALGCIAVVVGKVSPLIQEEGGLWVCSIDFLQYRAPIPAGPKVTQVIPDNTPTPPTTAATAQEAELQSLSAQWAARMGR